MSKPPRMRLSLRKRLKPYTSLTRLAEDLNWDLPSLKRRLRELDDEGRLSVEALSADLDPEVELEGENVYELFHQFESCLVCGEEMRSPQRRDIGWGEFKECSHCGFSAHDLASFKTRKEAAVEQIHTMVSQARKTQSVLNARRRNNKRFRERQPLF